jgi:hypothetical protein
MGLAGRNSMASPNLGDSDSARSTARGWLRNTGIRPKADHGIPGLRKKLIPGNPWFSQEPKFSSESKRVFGLETDEGGTVLPIASAVVLTKLS